MSKIKLDVVLDLSRGDCGKGKICHALATQNPKYYNYVLRFNGSTNCGHTIFHKGKKLVTHQLPSGVINGITSVIGNGCLINPTKFFEEIEYLESNGIDTTNKIKVAYNTHVILPEHIEEDRKDVKIGSTKQGNGPAYVSKYARTGKRAEDIPELKPFLIDMYKEFYDGEQKNIICEGAQGHYLDIDNGNYPFVTSSHCGIGAVLLNGFNHKHISIVRGVAKIYETYVGAMKFEGDDPIFSKIRELGNEYGATTGRPRQIGWLNLNELQRAIDMNGAQLVYLNKIDIFQQLNIWKLIRNNEILDMKNEENFKNYIRENINIHVEFSGRPDGI